MLSLWSDSDGTPFVLIFRADTVDLARTATAIGGGELNLDDLIFPVIDGRSPTDTVLSCGADRLLVCPIDEELAGINALCCVCLSLDITTRRTNDFDPILLLATDQNGSSDVA